MDFVQKIINYNPVENTDECDISTERNDYMLCKNIFNSKAIVKEPIAANIRNVTSDTSSEVVDNTREVIVNSPLKNLKHMSLNSIRSLKGINNIVTNFANTTKDSLSDAVKNLKTMIGTNNYFLNMFGEEKTTLPDKEISLPWHNSVDKEDIKRQILDLSTDTKNFFRSPPKGIFYFNLDENLPVAKILLEEDPRLKKLRFELVPKRIKEATFWRNYFYRISLIMRLSINKPSSSQERRQPSRAQETPVQSPDRQHMESSTNNKEVDTDQKIKTVLKNVSGENSEELLNFVEKDSESFADIFGKEIQELDLLSLTDDSNEEIQDSTWEVEAEKLLLECKD